MILRNTFGIKKKIRVDGKGPCKVIRNTLNNYEFCVFMYLYLLGMFLLQSGLSMLLKRTVVFMVMVYIFPTFREFMQKFIEAACHPNNGLFKSTLQQKLYPNVDAILASPELAKRFGFVARMLGKAIYERIFVEMPLATFFLQKLRKNNSDVDMHHLESLDPVFYRYESSSIYFSRFMTYFRL